MVIVMVTNLMIKGRATVMVFMINKILFSIVMTLIPVFSRIFTQFTNDIYTYRALSERSFVLPVARGKSLAYFTYN